MQDQRQTSTGVLILVSIKIYGKRCIPTIETSSLAKRNVSLVAICSFIQAKAEQQSDNFPRYDDAPGSPEGGYVVFLCSSNQKVINRYVLYVKHMLIK